jgi:hypothetical protein
MVTIIPCQIETALLYVDLVYGLTRALSWRVVSVHGGRYCPWLEGPPDPSGSMVVMSAPSPG